MIYGYHLIVCLLLIVFQSTILASAGPSHLYDLMAPFVVYLGVHRLTREAIPVLILGGLAMDGISGCVFGVHLTVYLWTFFGVRWAIQFLHVGNVIFLPLLVTAGVLFESLVVAFSAVVLESSSLAGGIHVSRCCRPGLVGSGYRTLPDADFSPWAGGC